MLLEFTQKFVILEVLRFRISSYTFKTQVLCQEASERVLNPTHKTLDPPAAQQGPSCRVFRFYSEFI